MSKRFVWSFVLLLFVLPAQGTPLSGSKSIGPTGDYASIGAAVADVQTQTLGGALVLELQASYVSSVETFPLVLTNLSTTATNTLTVRPQTGATGLSISSADATAATVDLNGAAFVTLDGRPGGVGSAKELTIANTSTSGVALRFINEASGNAIQYITLQGVNTSSTSGTVVFSTTKGANGNDSNTLDHCDIGDGASTPVNGLYAFGSTGTTAKNNSGNTVSNCNIFNFYAVASVDAAGVRLDGGNTDWTLSGNSFYQTASRAAGANVRGIYLNNTSGNNFAVTGNFIGGSAPSAGGTAWTTTGGGNGYRFQGIWLNAGSTTPSSVQGNTIQNIVCKSWNSESSLPGVWTGIYLQAGVADVGSSQGNTVGSGSGTGSVTVSTSGVGGVVFGIGSNSSAGVTVANNTVGSITVNGLSNAPVSLVGIHVLNNQGTINTISNNVVGSTTTANSLNAATATTYSTSYAQRVTGILSYSSGSMLIAGNTVANLNNSSMQTGYGLGQVGGIVALNGANSIVGNYVHDLSTTSPNPDASTAQSVYGIAVITSGYCGHTVSQNTVHSLVNTSASAAVGVTGIYFTSGFYGSNANVITRNRVHSLDISSSSAAAAMNGISCGKIPKGGGMVTNNMVCVGLKADGTSTAGPAIVRGIYDNGTDAGRNFYHNSVHVGGTQTSGASSSYAFCSTGTSNQRTFQNNIFVNGRSNDGATGRHYAVSYGGTAAGPAGLDSGSNLFLSSGTGGMLGSYNSADISTLEAWQAATGADATSAVTDPFFINPTGTASTVDLHLQASNPAEGGGLPIASVTDDYDGQARDALTPTDIGADAGNFTLSSDVLAPIISCPQLSNGSTASRVLDGWAAITDGAGVAGGANAPRLYFKKGSDADDFNITNDSSGNGWKYVIASGDGPFSFTLDYSLIYGGSVSNGDTIQYFVVVQDASDNLGSSPAGATASSIPPVPNINGHGAVNSFIIFPGSGSVTVGTNGDYASLSGTGGLFAAINGGMLAGDLVANVTSDLTEDGSVNLNQWTESGAGNYTLAIQPDSATMRTISGSGVASLITLNGADRVIIDGRFGGSGRYLTFRNTNTGITDSFSSTILLINDACGNTVRNCVVEGAGNCAIGFSTGILTGNDNNLITGCQVRDLTTAAALPYVMLLSTGSSTTVANSHNAVVGNELFNFSSIGISISTGNDSWTISGNNIHEVSAVVSSVTGINMSGDGANLIKGNTIHDLLTTNTSYGFIIYGITFGGNGTTTVERNRITFLDGNTDIHFIYAICSVGSFNSTLNVVNNQIELTYHEAILAGLYDSSNGGTVNVFHNSIVLGGATSDPWDSYATFHCGANKHTSRNNIFLNLRSGPGNHFAAGREGDTGSYIASHNVYAGAGATVATNFMDLSNTLNYAVPIDFVTWQSTAGDSNSQAGIAGSGDFTAAMFVDAANGDLHLLPGGSPLVNATGIPVAGVTTDYDGDLRSLTTPSIGADEVVAAAGIASWRQQYFGITTNSGNAADSFDFDKDGLPNLIEWACNLNPTTASSPPAGAVLNGAIFEFTYTRSLGALNAGALFSVEWSDTLANDWQGTEVGETILSDDGTVQQVKATLPAGSAGHRFVRLKVTAPP